MYSQECDEACELVNRERKRNGMLELNRSYDLDSLCAGHAAKMAGRQTLMHSADNIESLKEEVHSSHAGETLFRGFSVSEMHERAMSAKTKRSKMSRKTILCPDFAEIGVGIAQGSDGKFYMVQLLRGQPIESVVTKSRGLPEMPTKQREGPVFMFVLQFLGIFLVTLVAMLVTGFGTGSSELHTDHRVNPFAAQEAKVPLFVSGSRRHHYHHHHHPADSQNPTRTRAKQVNSTPTLRDEAQKDRKRWWQRKMTTSIEQETNFDHVA